jgi:class 3 adenylate cyclase
VETLEAGRTAARGEAWEDAWKTLTEADRQQALAPPDLELLADAAWWAGHPDESVDALERAYAGYVDSSQNLQAARVALLLAYLAARRMAISVASGWKANATRLLEDEPEGPVHSFLLVLDLYEAITMKGEVERGLEIAEEALESARRTGNREVESLAKVLKGFALVYTGEWMDGLALIDEATAVALAGDAGLRSASDVYCVTIATCRYFGDFRRAGEWTERADRWMSQHSLGGYSGVCRVHRAELKRLHGDWGAAETEALDACAELERYQMFDGVGHAHYEIGEVRLHMGDLEGAEAAFNKAYEFGVDPQPGMALLLLERGKVDEAAKALERSLNAMGSGPHVLTKTLLLPAQVEVALARDDIDTAQTAIEELDHLATEFERPAFAAMTSTARGQLALHEGDTAHAIEHLSSAWRSWNEIGFPFESARARTLLGRAHLAAGDADLARMELGAARSVFDRLGAKPALRQVEEIVSSLDGGRTGERVTKTFLFTDIVTSTDLIGVIGDERWESLLAWHDRTLRAVFMEHNGVEVNHTGDGFFVSFDYAGDAVEAAVTVQRRLAAHRREHGFAPSVRIGAHTDEATLDGSDYRGRGVHLASRVGSAAAGDEVVISAAALEAAGKIRHPISEARSVELKGIEGPVELYTVAWRPAGSD